MGKWDYVGGKEREKRKEERKNTRLEVDGSRWRGYDPQQNRRERIGMERKSEGQNRQIGRRNSERETGREMRKMDRYPRRNRVEAIVVHKAEQTESYANILKKVNSNINIEELGIRDTELEGLRRAISLYRSRDDCKKKADALAEEMKKVVGEEARVGRPSRKAEIRISGLDEDTTVEEVIAAVVKHGECERTDVKAGGKKKEQAGGREHLDKMSLELCQGVK